MRLLAPFLLLALASAPLPASAEEPRASAPLAPQQLNIEGFAGCLSRESPRMDLEQVRLRHRLGEKDLLLLFLSVYPGKRIPALDTLLQDPAHARWQVGLEPQEKTLADSLASLVSAPAASITPGPLFADALRACEGDAFCAAVILHNSLRTLGRHTQAVFRDRHTGAERDLNPGWFRDRREDWLARIPLLQQALIPLRPDGQGDRWGEWYHFFGILAFGLHEMALQHGLANLDFVVRLNELLNPLLAGAAEEPEKARLDRDSAQVAWRFAHPEAHPEVAATPSIEDCARAAAYVAF